MARLRSFPHWLPLGLSLALAGGGLVVTGCSKPKESASAKEERAKRTRPKPPKPRPNNPWLDELIQKAEVSVTYHGGEPIACEWDAGQKRHLCPEQERWVYVGPEVRRVGPRDVYCVWQHPVEEGVVTTKLAGLAKQPLELRHAFAGRSYTVKEAAPVDVLVRVDGEERAKAKRLREPGFEKMRIEPAEEGKPGDVEIVVSASHDGVAHFCWQIEALRADPAATAAASGDDGEKAAAAKAEGAAEGATTAETPSPARRAKPHSRKMRGIEKAQLRPAVPLKKLQSTDAAKER